MRLRVGQMSHCVYAVTSPLVDAIKVGYHNCEDIPGLFLRYQTVYGTDIELDVYKAEDRGAELAVHQALADFHVCLELFDKGASETIHAKCKEITGSEALRVTKPPSKRREGSGYDNRTLSLLHALNNGRSKQPRASTIEQYGLLCEHGVWRATKQPARAQGGKNRGRLPRSGITNVTWNATRNRWQVVPVVNHQPKYLGSYTKLEDAAARLKKWEVTNT